MQFPFSPREIFAKWLFALSPCANWSRFRLSPLSTYVRMVVLLRAGMCVGYPFSPPPESEFGNCTCHRKKQRRSRQLPSRKVILWGGGFIFRPYFRGAFRRLCQAEAIAFGTVVGLPCVLFCLARSPLKRCPVTCVTCDFSFFPRRRTQGGDLRECTLLNIPQPSASTLLGLVGLSPPLVFRPVSKGVGGRYINNGAHNC